MNKHIIMAIMILSVVLGIIFLSYYPIRRPGAESSIINSSTTNYSPEVLNATLRYRKDERCFVYLTYPSGFKVVDLVVWVHGGGFVGGNALGGSSSKVIRFFLKNGFAVASVEYRLCPYVNWMQLLRDIADGVRAVHEYFKERGIKVNLSIYVGSSAGAIAGAVLIYAPPNTTIDISRYFDGFIGFSGGYCASYAASDPYEKASKCNITISEMMPFDRRELHPPKKLPALLINGIYDSLLDKYAGKGDYNHHATCMAQWLRSNGINVIVVNLPIGHGTIKWLFAGDPTLIQVIHIFLEKLGWKGEIRPFSDLVVHWSFDKIKGKVLPDDIGIANGVIYGKLYQVKGVRGKALFFNGSGYVRFGKDIANLLGEFKEGSISLWFKFEEPPNDQKVLPIFYLGIANETENDNMFIIEIGHARQGNRKLYVTWIINDRPVLCFDSGFNLKPGKWYHLVVVVSKGSNTAYLNGKEIIDRHYNFGSSQKSLFLADIPIKEMVAIGYGKTGSKITPHFCKFYGVVDEVRIYSRPLTSQEIRQLYLMEFPKQG